MEAAVAPAGNPPAPEQGAEELGLAASGEKLTDEQEHSALHYLLGPRQRIESTVTVQYETPEGVMPLKFVIRAQDGRKIDAIEQANISETTGKVDQITANCQIVALATVAIVDEAGKSTDPKSDVFRTVNPDAPPLASPADALEARFRDQMGLLFGIAREVRRIGGWDPDKVGTAQRKLVTAAGN